MARVRPLSTRERSQGATLILSLGQFLKMDLNNRLTKEFSLSGVSKNTERAAACTLSVLTARLASAPYRIKCSTVPKSKS